MQPAAVLIWCTLLGCGAGVYPQMVLHIQLTWFRADKFETKPKLFWNLECTKNYKTQQAPSKACFGKTPRATGGAGVSVQMVLQCSTESS